MIWLAAILLIGQALVALTLLRITRTFGIYAERLMSTHAENVELRKNLAIQQNEEAISYLIDNPTEREA